MFDKYFDEYEVGEMWKSANGRTVTETDIVNFCYLSGDWYPLHSDKVWAEQGPFKKRIAHGLLIFSISSGLMHFEPGYIKAFYGIDHLRFTQPVFIGDTLKVHVKILEKIEKNENHGVIVAESNTINQKNEIVLHCIMKVAVFKRKKGREM